MHLATLLAIGCLLQILFVWSYFLLIKEHRHRLPTSRADLWPLLIPLSLLLPQLLSDSWMLFRVLVLSKPSSQPETLVTGQAIARIEGDFHMLFLGVADYAGSLSKEARRVIDEILAIEKILHDNAGDTGYLNCESYFSTDEMVKHLFLFYFTAPKEGNLQPFGADLALQKCQKVFETVKNADVGVWYEKFNIKHGEWDSLYVNTPPVGLGGVFVKTLICSGEPGFAEAQASSASKATTKRKRRRASTSRIDVPIETDEKEAEKTDSEAPRYVWRSVLQSAQDKLKKQQ